MSTPPPGTAWLFCPADRSERFAKAAATADIVILDLEDGVAAEHKPAARRALADAAPGLDLTRTVVRVNPVGTADHAADMALIHTLAVRTVMLAKTETRADVVSLGQIDVIGLCETARGVLAATDIASAANCVALMWGAEDLVADLGGFSSRDDHGAYRSVAIHARSHVLLAAAAAGIPALDAVYLDIGDLDGLRRESEDSAQSGFTAKVCVHPRQVETVRAAFTPSARQLEWAHRVISATEQPAARGVFAVDGRMVDEPILRQAKRILERQQQPDMKTAVQTTAVQTTAVRNR